MGGPLCLPASLPLCLSASLSLDSPIGLLCILHVWAAAAEEDEFSTSSLGKEMTPRKKTSKAVHSPRFFLHSLESFCISFLSYTAPEDEVSAEAFKAKAPEEEGKAD